ncbi:excalibur calcium-binding domain-containing protein [Microcoleus sp. A006_D1]
MILIINNFTANGDPFKLDRDKDSIACETLP